MPVHAQVEAHVIADQDDPASAELNSQVQGLKSTVATGPDGPRPIQLQTI